ncbi:sorting nexin-17 [Sitodiplosis mosellana]|uniref:sorting nexin-17 n=1 Tax=Sitodiplosis mosellana TaxID=263140 RepID=UPI002443A301|nr:sorting nexin-17 [Sitodiplosis mosellana]
MHFSIPDTQQFICNNTGANFTGFNIHINGCFHCCLRYKQIHCLHEQLKRCFPGFVLPPFPSKKFLPLTQNQLEQRRSHLERYIQLVGQDPVFSKCELLRCFLLNAQQESAQIQPHEVTLDVYLMNGYRIPVSCYTTDFTSKILEKAAQNIDLAPQFVEYFTLYLMRTEKNGDTTLVRRLMDFEAPYMTQRVLNDCQIVIRKSYWDCIYDQALFDNSVALNLLYILTLSDVDRDWILSGPDIRDQLYELQGKGNKKEYLQIARKLPSYGSIKFSNATADYPYVNNLVNILIGNKELSIQSTTNDGKCQETKFKITRMRCWRVTTNYNNEENSSRSTADAGCNSNSDSNCPTMELSFEYLMAKNILQWITITSEHAMLISVCLQSIVDELLNQKDGHDLRQNIDSEQPTKRQPPQSLPVLTYIRRDGQMCKNNKKEEVRRISSTSSNETISSLTESDVPLNVTGETFSFRKKLKEKLSTNTTVFFRNGKDSSVHNDAFEEIGDDDL